MKASETNISFNNKITESDSVNVYNNEYMYNGSGVGVGDFNNDGLQDLFFCGSMVSSRLYINKGNFDFEDITEKAAVETKQWSTGVSIVDINNDGFSDIYVCASHSPDKEKRKNQLFVNDGKLHFTEQASEYGLADTGFSTQAAFLDYDKDGDLDMYLLNHRLYNPSPNNLVPKDTSGNSPAADVLYRNEGNVEGQSHPVFHNVSIAAGIKEDGYGLGVVVTDVNNDNWPDLYVSNDYIGNDLLWLNNQDGTFSNIISTSIRHQSFNSMGVDAADFNNDCLPDVAVLDMLPETNERKKMMFSGSSQERYDMERRMGYEPEFVRNMLQLNNGLRKVKNHDEPYFSEIGQLAGISETNWSWSVLMADFDNDGWKDMHITNGLAKDVTNNDYVAFKNSQNQQDYSFASDKSAGRSTDTKTIRLLRDNLDQYGSIKVNNYFFRNKGDLTFSNATENTGLATPSVSNGAAYVDLDNDGDLDLVVNNMNDEAFVWRNEIRQTAKDSTENFITVQLKGTTGNPAGLGAKVSLLDKGKMQFVEQSPVRGFSSSVDERLHLGVGNALVIDSLKVEWPDDKVEVLKNVRTNHLLTIDNRNAVPVIKTQGPNINTLLSEIDDLNINFKHQESQYYDFGFQRGLPQKYSQLGPALATGDVNGDGLEDFFVGGGVNQPGKIYIQQPGGSFTAKDLVSANKQGEDLAAVFFDSDGDKDLDLLITSGSSEFGATAPVNAPFLYTNTGKGDFVLSTTILPAHLNTIASTITVSDYDGDGDQDVFIGGRITPEKYPESPNSYILQNNKGIFTDVTSIVCPALQKPGMIAGAAWSDFNNDHKPDLVICGEWMPVRFFANTNGKLQEVTNSTGMTNMSGSWRSLQSVDIDKDGDTDYLAGNMGVNNKYHLAADKPMMFYAKDLDNNGYADLIPAYYIKNKEGQYELFPGLDRNQLAEEVPAVKKKYLLHQDYSKINMKQLLTDYGNEGWVEKKCETMKSIWIENKGNGKFSTHDLPAAAQFAPINAILAADVDNDGNEDLVIAGNEYQADVTTGRYDASYGLVLRGNGKGEFVAVNVTTSGLTLNGHVKDLKWVHVKGKGKTLLAAINNDKLVCFKTNIKNK